MQRPGSRHVTGGIQRGMNAMRSGCLWLLGVPIPIIILLWLITGHA